MPPNMYIPASGQFAAALARDPRYAQALGDIERGTSNAPTGLVGGFSRLGQALIGGIQRDRVGREYADREQQAQQQLAALLQGAGQSQQATSPQSNIQQLFQQSQQGGTVGGGTPPYTAAQSPAQPQKKVGPDALQLGLALLGSGNTDFFDKGTEYLNAGIQQQARTAEKEAEAAGALERLRVGEDLERGTLRERLALEAKAREEDDKRRAEENRKQRKFEAQQNYLSRANQVQIARENREAQRELALLRNGDDGPISRVEAQRLQANSPSLIALAAKKAERISSLDTSISAYREALAILDDPKVRTGGLRSIKAVQDAVAAYDPKFSRLVAITEKIAPTLRAPGDIISNSDKEAYRVSAGQVGQPLDAYRVTLQKNLIETAVKRDYEIASDYLSGYGKPQSDISTYFKLYTNQNRYTVPAKNGGIARLNDDRVDFGVWYEENRGKAFELPGSGQSKVVRVE